MSDFSRKGHACTAFERALVDAASTECEGHALWVALARRIGVDQVAAIMDEVGGEKVHVPTRGSFFEGLFAAVRRTEIARRLANGENPTAVGRDYGMSRQAVSNIRNRLRRATSADDRLRGRVVKGRG